MKFERNSAVGLATCGVLLVLALLQILIPVKQRIVFQSKQVEAEPIRNSQSAAASSLLPLQTYAEIEKRPLFILGRRPPAHVATPAMLAPVQTLDRYAIVGIIAAPSRATAIIRGPAGETLHLRAGQAIDGWTLETITRDKLVFASGERRQELRFKSTKASSGQGPLKANSGMQR